ncbi:phage holin family protein [Salana multivorans]
MKELFWRTVAAAVGVWVADALIGGIAVTQVETWWQQLLVYLVVGLVLAIVQLFVKPLVQALTFILYILTLGLFGVIVNALMLMLCSWLTGHFSWGITVDGFWPAAVLGGIVVAIVSSIVTVLLPRPRQERR